MPLRTGEMHSAGLDCNEAWDLIGAPSIEVARKKRPSADSSAEGHEKLTSVGQSALDRRLYCRRQP
jgi:hypothetical protein